ncbi:MAG: biosynthetic-type acetolactate synthase large subunit [Clostridiaceae bacterium]|nr:biosynthetic-type acetolactate synthase large subunit [Clostridiaceae bacterium]
MRLKGAEVLVQVLIEQGVDCIFGYPGGAVLDIYDALYKAQDRIRHVTTCHEQGATHAADGYARVTGRPGVVIATSGPGATNLVTGIANAYLDSVPLVAITGNVARALIGRDSFQEVDITGITMPITKHNYMVKDVDRLADTVRAAFRLAASGRPGPVLIDIPKDMQTSLTEYVPAAPVTKTNNSSVDAASLDAALALIASSERPYIYSGGGVVISDASAELLALADRLDCPIGTSMMGLSAVPYDNPHFLGMSGMHGGYAASKALSMADLIIAIGTRFSDRATGNKQAYQTGRKILHIDIDAAEIDKNIVSSESVVGDVKQVLRRLLDAGVQRKPSDWAEQVHKVKSSAESRPEMPNDRLNPRSAIEAVNARLRPDDVVATDVGQHQLWTAQYYHFRRPRTFVTSGGLGTMGYGFGAAIGACFGRGKKRTVLFTSDGSFHMNMNEMATAVSHDLPVLVVVLNNRVLGMVRQWQTLFYENRFSNTSLARRTNYAALADAFGAKGYRVESLEALNNALDEALGLDGPALIDVCIDCDDKVLPMIPPGGTIEDIILKG